MTLNTQALLLACIAAAFATAATAQTCPFTDHADPSITYEAKVGGFLTDSRADHYRVEPDCRLRLVTSADLPRRVQAVLFVESDQRQTAEMVPGIERHMVRLQDMYRQSFGRTFTLANPAVRVLKARHNSDWYINTPDGVHTDPRWYRLGNMKNEVNEKLKRIDDDLRIRVVNYPIRVSNGKVGGNFGGGWMDGDDLTCIYGKGPSYPYDPAGEASCLGHVAHELGHVFGLGHDGAIDDCMQQGLYRGTVPSPQECRFGPGNRATVLSTNGEWLNHA